MREVRLEVEAVDPDDLAAQREITEKLRRGSPLVSATN
jgi:hypothetical protein